MLNTVNGSNFDSPGFILSAICGAVDVNLTLYWELIETVVETLAFSPVLAELASLNHISQS